MLDLLLYHFSNPTKTGTAKNIRWKAERKPYKGCIRLTISESTAGQRATASFCYGLEVKNVCFSKNKNLYWHIIHTS